MLLSYRLNQTQSIKSSILEVPPSIQLSRSSRSVAVPPFSGDIRGLDLSRKEAARQGIVDNDIDAVAVAARNEFLFERSGYIVLDLPWLPSYDHLLIALYIPWYIVGRTQPLSLHVMTTSATSNAVKLLSPRRTNFPSLCI